MVADGQLEGAQTPNATAPTKHTKASIVALRCAWEVPACNGYCLPVRVQERASPPLGARLRVPPKKGSRPAGIAAPLPRKRRGLSFLGIVDSRSRVGVGVKRRLRPARGARAVRRRSSRNGAHVQPQSAAAVRSYRRLRAFQLLHLNALHRLNGKCRLRGG